MKTGATVIVSHEPAATASPPALPRVTLTVFAQNSGVHPTRLAGFIRRMAGVPPARRTMLQWKQAYAAFLHAPIEG